MGLWNWVQTQFLGVDIAAEQARATKLDAEIEAMNLAAYESGQWTLAQYQQAQSNTSAMEASDVDYQQQVIDSFKEGAVAGLKAEQDAVKSAITGTASGLLGFLPTWLYVVGGLIAAGWLFLWLGGPKLLKG